MTTLPRLTPRTPATPCVTPVTRSYTSGALYGPYPPRELTSTWDFMQIPPRVNPIAPQPPKRRINSSWETVPQHWHNDQRRILMQQREHERYHSAWSKAFYGSPAEKEGYRRHFREVLKQQMADKDHLKKEEFKFKIKESEAAVAFDNQCVRDDVVEHQRKHHYLKSFRDDNKKLMEANWQFSRLSRNMENQYDREVLRYNPINWSCTLK